MDAKKFKNWTAEDFSWKWDGIVHNFPAGMEIFLEGVKADHFAKHLTDRELNGLGKPTNSPLRPELVAKCFPSDEVVSEAQALNIREEAKVKAKRGKKAEVKAEEEFPDLQAKESKA